MKNAHQLREEIAQKREAAAALVTGAETAKRSLTDDEGQQFDGIMAEVRNLETELQRVDAIERNARALAGASGSTNAPKEVRQYSILRAMSSLLPNGPQLSGVEKEMHEEAVQEAKRSNITVTGVGVPSVVLSAKRDLTATGETSTAGDQGGVGVQTNVGSLIDLLYSKMVLRPLGTQYLTGLQGNVLLPKRTSGSTAYWLAENTAITESTNLFSSLTMTPHGLGAYVEVSKQLMLQATFDAEQLVRNDIATAIALAVELAAINGSGSSNQPTGILNTSGIGSVAGGTNGAAPTWQHILSLEGEVALDNADTGSLNYLTNTKVRRKLKGTEKFSGTNGDPVFENGAQPLNGYGVGITNQVPYDLTKGTSSGVASAIIFGNFNDLIIGQWGGLDLIADPYTKATTGLVRIIALSFWDIAVRRAESFAAMKDALTT